MDQPRYLWILLNNARLTKSFRASIRPYIRLLLWDYRHEIIENEEKVKHLYLREFRNQKWPWDKKNNLRVVVVNIVLPGHRDSRFVTLRFKWQHRCCRQMLEAEIGQALTRPPKKVEVLAVLDFQIPCFRPETPPLYPKVAHQPGHGRKLEPMGRRLWDFKNQGRL